MNTILTENGIHIYCKEGNYCTSGFLFYCNVRRKNYCHKCFRKDHFTIVEFLGADYSTNTIVHLGKDILLAEENEY